MVPCDRLEKRYVQLRTLLDEGGEVTKCILGGCFYDAADIFVLQRPVMLEGKNVILNI